MNNQRRKIIAKSLEKLKEAKKLLEEVKASEEKSLEIVPEIAEFDSKREAIDNIVSNLESIISGLEESIDTLDAADF